MAMKDAKRRERPMSAIAPCKPARYPRGTVGDGVLLDEWFVFGVAVVGCRCEFCLVTVLGVEV